MLRKRVITLLTFVDGVLFRTKKFDPDYRYTQNFVDTWSVDEIILLDISRPGQGSRAPFLKVVESFAKRCFVPLTAGGGIRSLGDVRQLMSSGADKITVNTGAIDRPDLIAEVSTAYGAQCAVVSIDARRSGEGGYEVFAEYGTRGTGLSPAGWASEAARRGAGEILITSIERDGSLAGYEIPLCRSVSEAVSIPVVVSAGSGNWKHVLQAFNEGKADAACLTNIYHFTETSIQSAKRFLEKNDILVRVDPSRSTIPETL